MNKKLTIWIGVAMFLATAVACSASEVFPVVHREPIKVRVIDGKGGRPQARVHIVLTAGYDRRDLTLGLWREEAVTDAEGTVRLSDTLRNLPLLRVEVLKRHACSVGSADAPISLERIRRDGLSGVNRCGFVSIDDAPGVLTVFVKGKSAKDDHAPANPAVTLAPQAKRDGSPKEPAPIPALTEDEVAQLLEEQN